LEVLTKQDFEDFNINHEIIKKIRKFKTSIEDNEIKVKESEDILSEIVRTLSEQGIDISVEVLGQKA
jgi:predicted DNA binding CopG/RHH family protein